MWKRNQRNAGNGLDLLASLRSGSIRLVNFDPQHRTVLDKQKYGNEGARQTGRASLPAMTHGVICDFMAQIERVLAPSAHLALWVDKYILVEAIHHTWMPPSGTLMRRVDMQTWKKPQWGMGRRFRYQSEFVIILQKQPVRAKGIWTRHNISDVAEGQPYTRVHPHAKPVAILKDIIEAVTKPGNLVVDPAAGSYATMAACRASGRQFLGCDLVHRARYR